MYELEPDHSPLDQIIAEICDHPGFDLKEYTDWMAWNIGGDIIKYKPVMLEAWERKQAEIYAFGDTEDEEYPIDPLGVEKMKTLENITGSI